MWNGLCIRCYIQLVFTALEPLRALLTEIYKEIYTEPCDGTSLITLSMTKVLTIKLYISYY